MEWRWFSVALAVVLSLVIPPQGAHARGMVIKMLPDAPLEWEANRTPVGPPDDPTAFVVSCRTRDLKTCLETALSQPADSVENPDDIDKVEVELFPVTSRGRRRSDLVGVMAVSMYLCGAQNCPVFVMRRRGPSQWEQVLDDFGTGVGSFDVPGTREPWFLVTIHHCFCASWHDVYMPVPGGYSNVFNEEVDNENEMDPPVAVATGPGIGYLRRMCTGLPEGAPPGGDDPGDESEHIPLFTTMAPFGEYGVVFSRLDGVCKGWPTADGGNSIYLVVENSAAGRPVAGVFGIGWRRRAGDRWLLFLNQKYNDCWEAPDPVYDLLQLADNMKAPRACTKGRCYQGLRAVAPGVVAVDWYRTGKNAAPAIHSEFLLVPGFVE